MEGRGKQLATGDLKFLARLMTRFIRTSHHLESVADADRPPWGIRLLEKSLVEGVKPSNPNEKINTLTKYNAKNWAYVTQQSLFEHYSETLASLKIELGRFKIARWQDALSLAVKWARLDLDTLRQATLAKASAEIEFIMGVAGVQPPTGRWDTPVDRPDASIPGPSTRPMVSAYTQTDAWTPEGPSNAEETRPSTSTANPGAPTKRKPNDGPEENPALESHGKKKKQKSVRTTDDDLDLDALLAEYTPPLEVLLGPEEPSDPLVEALERAITPTLPEIDLISDDALMEVEEAPPWDIETVDTSTVVMTSPILESLMAPSPPRGDMSETPGGKPQRALVPRALRMPDEAAPGRPVEKEGEWGVSRGEGVKLRIDGMQLFKFHDHKGDKYGNWDLVVDRPILIMGDSNISRLPGVRNTNVQMDSYPGAKMNHLVHVLAFRTKIVVPPKKVILSVGLNDRNQTNPSKLREDVKNLAEVAKKTFPQSDIGIPRINHSPLMTNFVRAKIEQLNFMIGETGYGIPKLGDQLFETLGDGIHWSPATAKNMWALWYEGFLEGGRL
ncbi:uncharacterized protein LOC130909871 [Corythoichthys intestinalis]|uniref:uncharacterized protein LOC130909871 n=1 Tax=Corythoichthys intestinalis TaxID=161448 RepID=UPI0025A58D4F|nr:uncharacterized protein LOC130909871 [Corythoichthys intestinalis]